MAAPAAWAHGSEQWLDLPSDTGRVLVQDLDLTRAVAIGRIPNPLVGIAIKAEAGDIKRATMTEEEVKEYHDLVCSVVSQAVKEWRPAKGQKGKATKDPLPTPEDVNDIPSLDRDRIFSLATHTMPADVLQGVMSLMGLERFRSGAAGADDAPGGGDDGEGTE